MVALTAVLGPRDAPGTYAWVGGPGQATINVPIPVRSGFDVFVSAAPDTASAGTSLGTFTHNDTGDVSYSLNHAVVDHIRGLIYAREAANPANNIPPAVGPTIPASMYSGTQPIGSMFPLNLNDLQIMRIKRFGITMLATSLTVAPVTMAVAGTATLVITLQPNDVASANVNNLFASNNPSVATVSTAGVVTGVAPGATQIKVTNKANGLIGEAQVTVTGTTIFRLGAPEAEPKVGKDGKKSYVAYKTPKAQKADEPEEEKTAEEKHTPEADAQSFVADTPLIHGMKEDDDNTPADIKALKAKKAKEEEDEKKKSKK